jgi:glycosyltransferase A (GT-A) superfamily protein (DUF2064 family)
MIEVIRAYTSRKRMQSPAVVLFARSPEREAAAKRMRSAAPLFRAVIAAWLDAARRCGATPLIACAASDREGLAAVAPHVERGWIEQSEGAFGARVAFATGEAFARGHDAVIVAAIDAPPPSDLDRAFDALSRGIAVIAPARDGGINFIGLTSPDRALLERLTPHRRDLVRVCREHLGNVVVLRAMTDIDSLSSLDAARRERAWRSLLSPVTLLRTPSAVHTLRGTTSPFESRPPPA